MQQLKHTKRKHQQTHKHINKHINIFEQQKQQTTEIQDIQPTTTVAYNYLSGSWAGYPVFLCILMIVSKLFCFLHVSVVCLYVFA